MNSIISIGLKVIAALGVGAAVYFGLNKMGEKPKSQPSNRNNNPNSSCGCNSNPHQNNCNNGMSNNGYPGNGNYMEAEKPETKGEQVVAGLRQAQDICGKAFSLVQNLSIAAENIVGIFGNGNPNARNNNNNNYGWNNGNGWNNNGYNNRDPYNNGYQDKYKDPPGFRRVSPFILEWVGVGNENNPNVKTLF